MAQEGKSSGVTLYRSKKVLVLPPGILGAFAALVTPDEKFGEPTLKLNIHYNPDQVHMLETMLQKDCIDALWDKFLEEAPPAKKAKLKKPSAEGYLANKLKDPHEKSKVQLPTLELKVKAFFKNKEGELIQRTIKAYDAKNNLLDLAGLKMNQGSVIQPIVYPGLFTNPLMPPQPSLQLFGVRILKLERWTGGGQDIGTVDDEALETLGDDFEAEDLSGFLSAMTGGSAKETAPKAPQADTLGDFDDEVPF